MAPPVNVPQAANCALCGSGNELKNYREYATFMATELTVDQVKARWNDLQFLDVREADEYAEFNLSMPNIPTSILMNDFDDFAQFDPNQPLLIVCAHGVRSQRAAELFKHAGFKTVYSLKGGLAEWHD
jgi:rhodanese-related sulfurtransferase